VPRARPETSSGTAIIERKPCCLATPSQGRKLDATEMSDTGTARWVTNARLEGASSGSSGRRMIGCSAFTPEMYSADSPYEPSITSTPRSGSASMTAQNR
jgi:hypothetical protein